MPKSCIAMFASFAALLAGCSVAPGSHDVCVDEKTTEDYSLAWIDALADAKAAGSVTSEQAFEAHGDSLSALHRLGREDWSGYCKVLDKLRARYEF